MTTFWILAGLMIAGAVIFMVPSLLRTPRTGTEIREDQPSPVSRYATVLSVVVLVPVISALLYYRFGAMEQVLLDERQQTAGPVAHAGDDKLPPVDLLLTRLEQRLQETPDDGRGWGILGQSYLAIGRYTEARDALARALELNGEQPQLLARYAEAMARANDGDMSGRPTELIDKALSLDPDNQPGLWLAGLAAFQRGDGATTLRHWRHLMAQQAPGSDAAKSLQQHIARAVAEFPEEGTAIADAGTGAVTPITPPTVGSDDNSIEAVVEIDPTLLAQAEPDDTLFIYARAIDGPKMPLAMARRKVSDLPVTVRLDNSMAMIPQMSLSAFPRVEIVARVSKAGSATPVAGDLTGTSDALAVGQDRSASVLISSVVQ